LVDHSELFWSTPHIKAIHSILFKAPIIMIDIEVISRTAYNECVWEASRLKRHQSYQRKCHRVDQRHLRFSFFRKHQIDLHFIQTKEVFHAGREETNAIWFLSLEVIALQWTSRDTHLYFYQNINKLFSHWKCDLYYALTFQSHKFLFQLQVTIIFWNSIKGK